MPARFGPTTPADHPAVRYGLALCDRGFYWESHEVLEAAWWASAPNGRDRLALRGLIQLANAGLKLRMGRPKAALRLLADTRACLADLGRKAGDGGVADALDGPRLAPALERLAQEVAAGCTDICLPHLIEAPTTVTSRLAKREPGTRPR